MPRESKRTAGDAYVPGITAEEKEEVTYLRQKASSLAMRGRYRECFRLIEENLKLLYFKDRWPENFHSSLMLHKRCYTSQDIGMPYEEYLSALLRKNGIPTVFASLVKGSATSIVWSAEFFRDLAMVSEHKEDYPAALGYADIMIKQDPLNSNAYLLRGWILQHMDLDDEAVAMFERALELNRSNYQASSALAEIRVKTDPAQALEYIQAAIKQAPNEPSFYASKARILTKMGDRGQAIAAWDDAIARDPLTADYSFQKGELLMAENQTIAAVRQFSKAVGADPAHTPSLIRLANLLADTQPETALSYINTVVTQQPENTGAVLLRARLLERTGENQAAVRSYRQVLESDPNNAEANASLGRLHLIEHPQVALGYFERAVEAEPRSVDYLMGKAQALEKLKDTEGAIKGYKAVLAINRELAKAWAALGDLHRDIDRKLSLEYFTKAAHYAPDYAYYHLSKGELLLEVTGDSAAALECFLAAERTDPGNAELQAQIGQLLEKAGNPTSAMDRYRKAVHLDPDLAVGWFGLAKLLRASQPDVALLHINSAIDLDATRGDYYYLKYQILLDLGHRKDALGQLMRTLSEKNATPDNLQEASLLLGDDSPRVALMYINRAIEMLPDNAEYLCARAQLLDSMGEKGKALGQFQKAVEMDPQLHAAEYGIGRILAERKKSREEALVHFERAIELEPAIADYHSGRARLLAADPERYEEALESFDRAIALDHQRWQDVLGKAELMEARADLLGAVEHYRRTLLINGDSLEANARLGVLLADRNPSVALSYLERAIELDPGNYLYHVWCGRILYARGDHGAAEGEYMTALELGGETDEVYHTLALVLYEKLPETALKYCRLAIERKPDAAAYHLLSGKIHLLLGEPLSAMECFAEALVRDPKCHEALAQTALFQFRRMDETCLETMERALKIDPTNADYLFAKARMLHELRGDLPGAIDCLRRSLHFQPSALEPRELLVELLGKNNNPVKRFVEKRRLDQWRQRVRQAEKTLLERDAVAPPPVAPASVPAESVEAGPAPEPADADTVQPGPGVGPVGAEIAAVEE